MKPKPFCELKNLTVPLAIVVSPRSAQRFLPPHDNRAAFHSTSARSGKGPCLRGAYQEKRKVSNEAIIQKNGAKTIGINRATWRCFSLLLRAFIILAVSRTRS